MAEQKQISRSAIGKGKRKPERIERDIDPGIANVCKLRIVKVIYVLIDIQYKQFL